jgi:serine kinase of HPr protein (carbohydrate metabolism regulator)
MNQATSMSGPRISAETVHASTVAIDGRAVLITGPSGSGKSDLALRLLDRGFNLVSDDRTLVKRAGDRLIASAPPNIAGKLEVRGIGIIDMEAIGDVPVSLLVELDSDIQRLPDDDRRRQVLGVPLPIVNIDALQASAPSKVALALDRMGLKF